MNKKARRTNVSRLAAVVSGTTLALTLGIFAGGCSSSTPANGDANQVEMTFDLSKCQPIDQTMYKCPAIDKPICNPNNTPAPGVECVRIGNKGSVFVMTPGNAGPL
ncbi:MAG TPA: hypothetical protein VEJ86_09350 [Candidatus Binataceae bacterium]|nr:hypothetical protein [Candidatus Binataceae bacterium]